MGEVLGLGTMDQTDPFQDSIRVPMLPSPVATQADGTFEFTAAGKDFDPLDAYIHWGFTPLVATAEGHAMVWGAAAAFESSGALLKELRADPKFSEQDSAALLRESWRPERW